MSLYKCKHKILLAVIIGMTQVVSVSCQDENSNNKMPISEKELKEKLIEANIRRVKSEKLNIDSLIMDKGWTMDTTGTGLRYEIIKPGSGDSVKINRMVEVKYTITSFAGDTIYSSKNKGNKEFKVGMDHIETGIHEAVIYMKVGDVSRVILPSHLAHGFMGDDQSIPSNATLIYYLEIVSVR